MYSAVVSFIAALAVAIVPSIPADWMSYLVVPAFFFGRELAQAECRYADANGIRHASRPLLCGFAPSAWHLDGMMNWIISFAISLEVFAFQDLIQAAAGALCKML